MTTTTVRKVRRKSSPPEADRKAVQSFVSAAYLQGRLRRANISKGMRRVVRSFINHLLDEVDQSGDADWKAVSRFLRERNRGFSAECG